MEDAKRAGRQNKPRPGSRAPRNPGPPRPTKPTRKPPTAEHLLHIRLPRHSLCPALAPTHIHRMVPVAPKQARSPTKSHHPPPKDPRQPTPKNITHGNIHPGNILFPTDSEAALPIIVDYATHFIDFQDLLLPGFEYYGHRSPFLPCLKPPSTPAAQKTADLHALHLSLRALLGRGDHCFELAPGPEEQEYTVSLIPPPPA